ncbi:MFS transporter [Amycolatopsis nigrescens]|uniref:MFS transporter n=1 Tax=Amycolatopsis nigrescens TaxID=381445 RepID=UPI0012FCEFC0|nr:MFS transporter [Amycolatopsis nigrescens]
MSPRVAVTVVFALNGATLGSWAPRVPALADRLQTEPGPLGLAMLCASVGMLLAASFSGRLIEAVGARAVNIGSGLAAAVLLPLVGFAPSVVLLGVALFGLGASVGVLDVAMNVAAVSVERQTGRPIMPTFHAGFSFGALAGSATAGLAASHQWSPGRQLGVAAIAAVVVLLVVWRALPGARPDPAAETAPAPATAPVRRPVLWLLAAVALCSAIAEGASSDWSALLMVTEHGVGDGAAALAYSAFALAMAIARLGGAWMQRRYGATRALAGGAAVAAIGLTAAAVLPVPAVAYVGFALAGAGLAACFPIALGLAGEAGKRADDSGGEREIAFVTAIAYTGFLAGPPLIGGIAQATSLSTSFVVVAVVAAIIMPAAIGAGLARRRERVPVG